MDFNISVVIPALNAEGYLPALLESIEAQNLLPKEIIIIDSSPSNMTADIIEQWQGVIPILYHKAEFAYPGHARNMGVKLAQGEWIAFIDCRTTPDCDWLEISASTAEQSGAEFVGALCIIEADTPFKQLLRAATYGCDAVRTLPGSIVLKRVFEQSGGFNPDVRAGEDLDWMHRLRSLGVKISRVAAPTIKYNGFVESLSAAVKKWYVYALANASFDVRNNQKKIYLLFFISSGFLLAWKWNAIFARWDEGSIYYAPNITKIFMIFLCILYIVYRGIIRPLQVNVKLSFLFSWRWLGISFIGLCLDIAKAPGLICGAILLLNRRLAALGVTLDYTRSRIYKDGTEPLMNRKLLFVVNVDWFFLSHRLPIALAAMQQGYQVHIATGLTDRLDELQRNGLVVHPLALDRSSAGLGSAWRTMVQLWQIFRAVRPDVAHLVTIKPVLLGGLVARLAGVPAVVAAVSGLGFVFVAKGVKASARRLLVVALYRFALGHHNLRVIFQNPDDRASLARLAHLPGRKVSMIRGSGVDLTQYDVMPMPPGMPVVVLAARLLADKGVLEFVEAARLLKQRGCNARFVLVGTVDTANPTSFTDAEVSAWMHDGVVEWWGHRADMPQVLAAAQVVVLPSYYGEGLPKVLIEAAACGRVVVTTDHPGCRDAIDPGVTGVLVPVRNAVALADAIATLINDPLLCKVMGDAGRALAEKAFDVRQVVAAHLQIYQELTAKS